MPLTRNKQARSVCWGVFLLVLLPFSQLLGQSPETVDTSLIVSADTINPDILENFQLKKETGWFRNFVDKDYPNPRKAALLSLIPGGGQVYNRKLWWVKVPVIYGGLVGIGLVADYNTKQYKCYRDAYLASLAGEELPEKFDDLVVPPSTETLKRIRDIYDKRRQQSYLGLAAIYLANILEAYVSCHLLEFDVSEDLSIQFLPPDQAAFRANPAVGLYVTF